MSNVKAIPDGYHTITPHVVIKDASKAIEFYKKAFGAEEICRMPGPGGKGVMHAEIQIGNSRIMMCDEMPNMEYCVSPTSLKGTTFGLMIYVEDVNKAYQRAVDAGATAKMPVTDMFWGDRYGKLTDPFGHEWAIATHKEDVSPEECGKRAEAFFANMSG